MCISMLAEQSPACNQEHPFPMHRQRAKFKFSISNINMQFRNTIPIGCTKPKEFTRACVMIMHETEHPHNAYRYMYVQKYSETVAGYMSMTLP